MLFETPAFWEKDGLVSRLLIPFSWLYLIGHKLKTSFTKPYKSSIPVICIGGAVVGGSGKTPTVHAILELIGREKLSERPVIITRGYGGTLKGPSAVDIQHHTARDVGDEALLHATYTPTIVARDRAAGARLAEAMDADLILLDDGLQNNSLAKSISFLVLDTNQGVGNGRLLPAGPMREPMRDALSKSAAVVQINGITTLEGDTLSLPASISIITEHDKAKSYFAFAGLGRPQKFKETLLKNGFTLAGFKAFPDHHPYTDEDIEILMLAATPHRLITTEKDFVKLPEKFRDSVDVVSIALNFSNNDSVTSILKQGLNAR